MTLARTILFISIALLLSNCQSGNISKSGMIKVTILYPSGDGNTFDMEYYADKHMPMIEELFGESLKELEIDEGIGGGAPQEPSPYLAIGYLYFDKLSDYENAFETNSEKILGDIPNYTNVRPVIQVSKVIR